MSELKRRHINEVMDMFCLTKGDLNWAYVYYADDADKVIEQLKADYQEACGRLQTANLIKNEQLAAARHQKWKRCLAMANYWVAVSYQCVDDKHRQSAERHHRKWLELAEKFKTNSTAQ